MNLTISVLEGLLLLLPGLTALGAWNFIGSRAAARRPELPLTAVNALAVAMLATLATHLVGIVLCVLIAQAAREWNAEGLVPRLPVLANPFASAVKLLDDHSTPPSGASFFDLLAVIFLECLLVARIVSSRGVSLVFAAYDLRGVGWAHKHYMEPLARGYTPVAFVMLKAFDKTCGLGYAGPIADLRFGAQGEVASISLGRPQRFVYEVTAGSQGSGLATGARVLRRSDKPADLTFRERTWVGGVVHLAAADIHNLVVHNFSSNQFQDFNAEARR